MRYSIGVKFIVIILCAVSLVSCVAGGAGILLNESYGMYTKGIDQWVEEELREIGHTIAYPYAALYAAEHLGGCTGAVLDTLQVHYYHYDHLKENWSGAIYQDGVLLEGAETPPQGALEISLECAPTYPVLLHDENVNAEGEFQYRETLYVYSNGWGRDYEVEVAFYSGPMYQVVLYLQPDLLNTFRLNFMTLVYTMRYQFIAMLVMGLLLFAATLVYLCCIAGRRPHCDKVYPVALNRLPLDFYLFVVIAAESLLWIAAEEMLYACFAHGGNWAVAALIALSVFLMALLVVCFLFACAAQMKTKGGFWWRRTIIGWCLTKLWQGIRLVIRGWCALFELLPMVWQWLVAIFGMLLLALLSFLIFVNSYDVGRLLGLLGFFGSIVGFLALIAYWAYCMGHLMKGVVVMTQGGLHYRIPTRHLRGKFLTFANSLNSMAGAARIAAEQQLKSERMKTELITNVSHDIKTPLTSIINYVDLLQKPHDGAQEAQYLEVLERQSQRLKKLIEDLMEMSKASTGNLHVEMGYVDAVEAINQALGEFSDKLNRAGLYPVFRCPQEPVMIQADGKLLWRILSNLLNNAVKYAMPGTRFYIDLVEVQGNAVLNLKNISREQLNIDAEELMERFVRGDTARNTEGSGLGLNIAKSLVELQQGQMHLMVDGDLFKVTVIFPLAQF